MEALIVETPVVKDSGWDFRLSPYAWFVGLKSGVANILGLATVPIDVSSSDALEDTEASLMLMFEAKKNGKGFFMDVFYSAVQLEETLIEANDRRLVLNSTTKTTMVSRAYLYEEG